MGGSLLNRGNNVCEGSEAGPGSQMWLEPGKGVKEMRLESEDRAGCRRLSRLVVRNASS